MGEKGRVEDASRAVALVGVMADHRRVSKMAAGG